MVTRRQTLRAIAVSATASALGAAPTLARVATTPAPAPAAAVPVDDVDAASLHELVEAAAPWSTVTITRDWVVTESLVLTSPITLRFAGGSISTDAHIAVITVRSSDVRIDEPVLRGRDGTVSGLGRGVHAAGTPDAPLRNIEIRGGSISGHSHDGVLLEHVGWFAVSGVTISGVGYAGILMFSCTDGAVSGNRIDEVHQPSPYVNSYGIEAVRATTAGTDRFPRSARITISDNLVRGVRSWEGIDTHGGEEIVILRNRVEDCRVGIALVPSKDEADASKTKYAPLACAVIGNSVTRSTRGAGSGIVVRGAGETVDSPAERATGVLLRNAVSGYGDADRDAPILVYLTRDLIVADNELQGFGRAISLYHSNADVAVQRNSVLGLERLGAARSVGIAVVATANSGIVAANQVSVGDVGLQCRLAPNALLSVANTWGGAGMDPVVAAGDSVLRFLDG